MAAKLFNLLAISSVAVILCALGPQPVTALSVESHGHLAARHVAHDAIALKKRAPTRRRCKPVSATIAPASSTSKPTSTKNSAPAATTKASSGNGGGNSGGSSGGNSGGSGGYKGTKVGLAWPNGDDASLASYKTGKVSYIYTWSPYMPSKAKSLGFKHAPMLWGTKHIDAFKKLVKPGYADVALGFNEPDHSGQAALDPGYAADLWKQYMNPLKSQGYRLISPAVTNGPSGKVWFQNFLNACNGGCIMDAHAVHHYDTDPQTLIAYLKDWHSTFGMPIWLTEFACTSFGGKAAPSMDDVWAYQSAATNFLDSTPWIEVYMPFGAMKSLSGVNENNRLMNAGSSQPTDLYWGYAN